LELNKKKKLAMKCEFLSKLLPTDRTYAACLLAKLRGFGNSHRPSRRLCRMGVEFLFPYYFAPTEIVAQLKRAMAMYSIIVRAKMGRQYCTHLRQCAGEVQDRNDGPRLQHPPAGSARADGRVACNRAARSDARL
jgi:hypothetical protein